MKRKRIIIKIEPDIKFLLKFLPAMTIEIRPRVYVVTRIQTIGRICRFHRRNLQAGSRTTSSETHFGTMSVEKTSRSRKTYFRSQ